MIASLAQADQIYNFQKNMEDYFSLLDDESVMVASHAALNSAKIAIAYPDLQTTITRKLLDIDQAHHSTGHLALVKAYIIEALAELFDTSEIQPEIIKFAKAQVNSESPKTAKLAKAFIEKYQNIG